MKRPVFLEGRHIYLRPIDLKDLERFYRWFNDPELRRLLLLPLPTTRMAEREFIKRMTRLKDGVVLSILVKRGGRLIGNVSLFRIDGIHRSADLGIAIADLSMASRGFGTEAIGLMLDYAFGTLNLNRVGLAVHDFNRRALAAYRRAGFVEEGRKRQSHYCDGRYHDDIMMSVLREEWERAGSVQRAAGGKRTGSRQRAP